MNNSVKRYLSGKGSEMNHFSGLGHQTKPDYQQKVMHRLLKELADEGHIADLQLTIEGDTVITCVTLPTFKATFKAPKVTAVDIAEKYLDKSELQGSST